MNTGGICDRGCSPDREDCQALCGCEPPWLREIDGGDLTDLLGFANQVAAWSFEREGQTTYAQAAEHFAVTVETINQAVVAHYWLFTSDTDRPLAGRRIEHEGE
ncbi:MAG TPA: hypothetical protein VF474_16420 [Phenylobacterium sp.]